MNDHAGLEPAVDMKKCPIVQVGIVVADAARTARNYSRLFGVGPWVFSDDSVAEASLHGRPLQEAAGSFRGVVANFGNLQIELIQPLWGPGTHIEYLRQRGEGVHHLSFGIVEGYDEIVRNLQQRGVGSEMQGVVGGCITACYLDTARELGTFLEFVRPLAPGAKPMLGQWGVSAQPGHALAAMGSRPIAQVGIVVHDAEGTARRYEDLVGIGPWKILNDADLQSGGPGTSAQPQLATWAAAPAAQDQSSSQPPAWTLHGVPMLQQRMRLKIAVCDWEGLQLKLIEPLSCPGIYWEFLNSRGPGVHHLSFGHVAEYDTLLETLSAGGIEPAMTGTFGNGGRFAHLDTARELGVVYQVSDLPHDHGLSI